MRDTLPPSPSVVVGIDGSRSALTAASWAVDEAVARDVPLRLVYAIDEPTDDQRAVSELAAAEAAIRQAVTTVEASGRPVRIEVEIKQDRPSAALLDASRDAAMLCIGAVGTQRASVGSLGSTAGAVVSRAHCPVAVVRGYDPSRTNAMSIVVEVDMSSDTDTVLQRGIDEALLRGAPLVVISVWHPHFTDVHDGHAVAEQNRQVRAELNRRLARTRRRHPELEVQPVAVHGNLLNYLSRHAASIQLVIVGPRRAHGVAEMIGPPSYAALHDTECSVLVCDTHGGL
ncbi:universal stress protein [Mycolicibacterium sp. 050158]|uniref:universal stress protein n=1 Tax=Mycolicibacterium sp. 050158 TaxID=3090602 RepID=UPI00299DA6B1|nr:universal stress protein [Mycolicibacterium sp. 050158]MDX1890813.1 universal stress protein [Mycolicibacterium sp. 050158]